MDYLPLLIYPCTTAGGSYSTALSYGSAIDPKASYGLWLQHSPYTGRAKAQNIISQTWKDQDGEDTFIPTTVYHEVQEIEFTCVALHTQTTDGAFNANLKSLIDAIEGRWLKIYDSYTQQGRKGVYLIECGDIEYKRRGLQIYATVKLKFKVNDPTIYTSTTI